MHLLVRLYTPCTTSCTQSYPQKLWNTEPVQSRASCAIIACTYLHGATLLFSIIQAAGWPIWPLIACSILALAIVIERFVSLKTSKVAPARLLDEVLSVTRTGVPAADVVAQLEKNSALGEVLASGLRAINVDARCSEDDLRATMEGAGRVVAHLSLIHI